MADVCVCPRCGTAGDGACARCGTTAVPTVINTRFRVKDLLVADSLGTRWTGEDLDGKVPVHIRLGLPLDEGSALLFRRNSHQLTQLEHHNLPHVLYAAMHARVPAVVTEPVDGIDLASEVQKSGPLGVQRTMVIATQVLKALHELHSAGVAHGNVRAPMVMLTTSKGRADAVKLLDGGIPSGPGVREMVGDLRDVGLLLHLMVTGKTTPPDGKTLEESGIRTRPDVLDVVQRFVSPSPDRRPVSALHGLSLIQKLLPAPVEVSNVDLLALDSHEFAILEVEREARLKALAAETTTGGSPRPSSPSTNLVPKMVGMLVLGAFLGAGVMYAITHDRPGAAKTRPNAARR